MTQNQVKRAHTSAKANFPLFCVMQTLANSQLSKFCFEALTIAMVIDAHISIRMLTNKEQKI